MASQVATSAIVNATRAALNRKSAMMNARGRVIMIITGAAGAELWKTADVRNMNQYTLISMQDINPVDIETGFPGPTFDPVQVKVPGQSFTYMYIEEPWVMAYTFIADSFALLMPLMTVLFFGLLVLSILGVNAANKRKAELATAEGGDDGKA